MPDERPYVAALRMATLTNFLHRHNAPGRQSAIRAVHIADLRAAVIGLETTRARQGRP